VNGFIEEVLVKEGDKVVPGQVLARLSNRELEQSHVANEQRMRAATAILQRALGLDRPAEQKQAENTRMAYEAKFEETKRDVGQLVLRASTGGTVLTRNLELKAGHLLRSGELFCEIASLDPMRIRIALREKQVRYVQRGQRVEIKANAYPGRTIVGKIAADPLMFIGKNMPAAFSARRSGDVPTAPDGHGNEVPVERTFEAQVEVDNHEGLLRQGMTGRARIFAGTRPWGELVLHSLRDLVSLEYRF
jgi:multidrug resistance efflux pump